MDPDRILVLANQIGYEIFLPGIVMARIQEKNVGDEVSLYIYYNQTERQPKPVLIGFMLQSEKEFFQHFISVSAIGPLKAINALTIPIEEMATAIEAGDIKRLAGLKGIGRRTAQKIIATLQGKIEKFASVSTSKSSVTPQEADFQHQVFDVLVAQMGHKPADAKRLIDQAMIRNPDIISADMLIDEVYRGERA
jgi:Holliday junction DNA helicase RuvA